MPEGYMQRAIELAQLGQFSARPNPCVGCVIVKDSQIIGEGYHVQSGQPHAEINALNACRCSPEGATVYVTLEPCSHQGKTPPCVDALIAANVAKVVIAQKDLNPQVNGCGIQKLKAAGVTVEVGLMSEEATALNKAFNYAMMHQRPYVTCKVAMSLDAHTALASGESQWITCEAARQDVQYQRAQHAAIITGINTVMADDARLTVRTESWPQVPVHAIAPIKRVVCDSQLRILESAAFLNEVDSAIIATAVMPEHPRFKQLEARGVTVWSLPNSNNQIDLAALLNKLYELNIYSVMVEAGSILTTAFLAENLAQELVVYMGNMLMGRDAQTAFDLSPVATLKEVYPLTYQSTTLVGQSVKLVAIVTNGAT